jgi:hypothetical protein
MREIIVFRIRTSRCGNKGGNSNNDEKQYGHVLMEPSRDLTRVLKGWVGYFPYILYLLVIFWVQLILDSPKGWQFVLFMIIRSTFHLNWTQLSFWTTCSITLSSNSKVWIVQRIFKGLIHLKCNSFRQNSIWMLVSRTKTSILEFQIS